MSTTQVSAGRLTHLQRLEAEADVDTTFKFSDMYAFRDDTAAESGLDLIVHQNLECVEKGINPFDHGSAVHTDMWKTDGLKQVIDANKFDLCFGGARRDEEKPSAKERIFSIAPRSISGIRSGSGPSCGRCTTPGGTSARGAR